MSTSTGWLLHGTSCSGQLEGSPPRALVTMRNGKGPTGMTSRGTARDLYLSGRTVGTHLNHSCRELDAAGGGALTGPQGVPMFSSPALASSKFITGIRSILAPRRWKNGSANIGMSDSWWRSKTMYPVRIPSLVPK